MSERGASGAEGVGGDRRDSLRLPIRLMVRETARGGSYDEHDGDISLGGVFFTVDHAPPGTKVELRFLLPGENIEVRVAGEILEVSSEGTGYGAHVRFEALSLEDELAIARFLEKGAARG
jgi:uncharacterized protein (TIGR02266 family)